MKPVLNETAPLFSLGLYPFILLCAAASLCGGCVATQKDILEMEQQTDEVKAQITDLKQTITSLQANQADLAVKMDQMHSDVNSFREAAKDSLDSMNNLSAKLDELEAALGRKLSGATAEITKQQNELAAKITAQESAAVSGPTPSQIFHAAQASLGKKNYEAAIEGFSDYLQKYPKGEMADLAVYYLGQSYYGKKSWENAAKQFATVLDRYPKSDVTPGARLKYATCLINLKSHMAEAKRYLQSIPEDFPKSPEAAAAEKLLEKFAATTTQR